MREELRSLGVLLLSWFTLITGFITLWWFLSSAQPLAVKVIAASLLFMGTYSLVLVRLVKLRERVRYNKRISSLEREIQRLDQRLGSSARERWSHDERPRKFG